jgi:hypothetical protein
MATAARAATTALRILTRCIVFSFTRIGSAGVDDNAPPRYLSNRNAGSDAAELTAEQQVPSLN